MKREYCVRQLSIFFLFLLTAIILSAFASATDCGGDVACACNDTLVASRTLNESDTLTGCTEDGLLINAGNIQLDCAGYIISGDGDGTDNFGVFIQNLENVTVVNCNIIDFNSTNEGGIYIWNSSTTISNSNVTGDYAVYIYSSSGSRILNSNISGITSGLYIESSQTNLINNSEISGDYASYITSSLYNNITYSIITGTTAGVYFESSSNNRLVNLSITANYGVYLTASSNRNTISNSTVSASTASIVVESGSSNSGCGNTVNNGISQPAGNAIKQSCRVECADNIISNTILSENLNCSGGGNALVAQAENITIDCNGFSIIGADDGTGYGISINDYNNITVQNCNISRFGEGIYLYSSTDSKILNNNLSWNSYSGDIGAGIYLSSADRTLISGNYIFNNEYGIYFYGDDSYYNNTLQSNTIEDNNLNDGDGDYGGGIYLAGTGEGNKIAGNIIRNHTVYVGMYIGITNTNISNNLIENSYDGIYLSSSNNVLGNNNLSSSSNTGISGGGTETNWSITGRNKIIDSNITINGIINISGSGVLELINSYLTYNGAFISQTGNLTSIPDGCGGTITNSKTLVNNISMHAAGNCVVIGADNIVLDCNGYTITGDNSTNTQDYGVYANTRSNVTIKNCNIKDLAAGIYFDSVSNSLVTNNNISNNGYEAGEASGAYMSSTTSTTVSNNHFFNNDIGMHLNACTNIFVSLNVIENNNFVLSNLDNTGYGIKSDSSTNMNVSNNNITGNNNYGIYNSGVAWVYNNQIKDNGKGIENIEPESINWIINDRALCKNNDITLSGFSNITFTGGGVLELDNCTITLNSLELNLTGNITSLDAKTEAIEANVSEELEFENSDSNITLLLADNITIQIAVYLSDPTSEPSGLSALKGIDIQVDNSTKGNLTWALIKIFYNDSEVTAAGLDESTLKIYYYNSTASAWQLEPNQGVNTADNYIWANITHFSIFGAFGSAPTTAAVTAPSSGTGGGCVTNWTCTAWSSCINNIQSRICTKTRNYCYAGAKPAESQSCSSEALEDKTAEEKKTAITEIKQKIAEIAKAAKSNVPTTIIIIIAAAAVIVGIIFSLRTIRARPKLKED